MNSSQSLLKQFVFNRFSVNRCFLKKKKGPMNRTISISTDSEHLETLPESMEEAAPCQKRHKVLGVFRDARVLGGRMK